MHPDRAVEFDDAIEFGLMLLLPARALALRAGEGTVAKGHWREFGGEPFDVVGRGLFEAFDLYPVSAMDSASDGSELFELLLGVVSSPLRLLETLPRRADAFAKTTKDDRVVGRTIGELLL